MEPIQAKIRGVKNVTLTTKGEIVSVMAGSTWGNIEQSLEFKDAGHGIFFWAIPIKTSWVEKQRIATGGCLCKLRKITDVDGLYTLICVIDVLSEKDAENAVIIGPPLGVFKWDKPEISLNNFQGADAIVGRNLVGLARGLRIRAVLAHECLPNEIIDKIRKQVPVFTVPYHGISGPIVLKSDYPMLRIFPGGLVYTSKDLGWCMGYSTIKIQRKKRIEYCYFDSDKDVENIRSALDEAWAELGS